MLAILPLLPFLVTADPGPVRDLEVEPARVRLIGSDGSAQLVVTGRFGGGPRDLTREAVYACSDPGVAEVGADGSLRPKRDGQALVVVKVGEIERSVEVVVEDMANSRRVAFSAEVVPIFTRYGCNAGNCHGKSTGQNGFRMSLLGFDPKADWEALVREGRGRRIVAAAPSASLLLRKSTAKVPHGGGRKFAEGLARIPDHRPMDRPGRRVRLGPGAEARLDRREARPPPRPPGRAAAVAGRGHV